MNAPLPRIHPAGGREIVPATYLEGWFAHDGNANHVGRCPLPYSAVVQVRFKSGLESDPSYAGFWGAHGVTSAWDRKHPDPIVAYRHSAFELLPEIKAERRAKMLARRHDRIAAERREAIHDKFLEMGGER